MLSARAYSRLPTEQPNPRTRNIDRRSTLQIVRLIAAEDSLVPKAVARVSTQTARAVDILAQTLSQGGAVHILGAGTSGRLAVLEAAECPPTFNTSPNQVQAIIAGGKSSVFRAKEGAEDNLSLGKKAVSRVHRGDTVIGVAASGVTPFVRMALKTARRKGAHTVLITSNGSPSVDTGADIIIAPDVGPEVVTGSTRLKSATAAKLVLNSLTTGAMIKIGKVYDHWMVDLKPSSRKLRLRAERIVCELGKISLQGARQLLKETSGNLKVAVLMARLKLSQRLAQRLLKRCHGQLRLALREVRS